MSPSYQKYRRPHKKSPYYRIVPSLERFLSGRQLTGKDLSRPGGRRAGRIFASKLSAGGDFSGGGDSVMGHRPVVDGRTNGVHIMDRKDPTRPFLGHRLFRFRSLNCNT